VNFTYPESAGVGLPGLPGVGGFGLAGVGILSFEQDTINTITSVSSAVAFVNTFVMIADFKFPFCCFIAGFTNNTRHCSKRVGELFFALTKCWQTGK
jgi:hypothetical protein